MMLMVRSSWALLIGILLIQIGNGMQSTLLGIRGSSEGFSAQSMGYIMSGYFIGFLGGSTMVSLLLKRVGHVRVYAALGSFASAAFILYPVFVDPIAWFVLRIVVGFCLAGLYIVSESWLNDMATNKTRGKLLSLYMIMQMIGIIVGQIMINADDPNGYNLFILMSVLVSLSFAPVLLSMTAAPVASESSAMSIKALFKVSPLSVVGMFLLGGIFSALFGMVPVYASLKDFPVSQITLLVMVVFVGGTIMQYPIGWLSDIMDRRILTCVLAFLSSVSCILAFIFDSLLILWSVAFFIGGTANGLYTLLVAYTNDYLESHQMAAASGGLIFVNGVGAMGGPIMVGYLMETIGAEGFWLYLAILMGVIVVYSLYRMTQRSTADETAPYTIMPMASRATSVINEMATEEIIEAIEVAEAVAEEEAIEEAKVEAELVAAEAEVAKEKKGFQMPSNYLYDDDMPKDNGAEDNNQDKKS